MQNWFVRYPNGTGGPRMTHRDAVRLANETGGELCLMRDKKRPARRQRRGYRK